MTEVAETPVQSTESAGQLLRRAREASGLHVAALAVALKVPVRKLEALEEDRYDDLGDAVFVRGLASSVCRTLKVDPSPVLERLPQTSAPRLVRDSDGLNAPFRAPGDGPAPRWFDRLRAPVPALVLALLAGAVAIYFAPVTLHDEAAPGADAPVASPAAPAATGLGLAPTRSAPLPVLTASEPAKAGLMPVPAPAATRVAPISAPLPVAASSAATAAAPASGLVVVRAKGESWVEVVDAKGVVAVRKLMVPGEATGATGALPLVVTIGKADLTEVEVRGKKFDLKPVSRDNVARFEVK